MSIFSVRMYTLLIIELSTNARFIGEMVVQRGKRILMNYRRINGYIGRSIIAKLTVYTKDE